MEKDDQLNSLIGKLLACLTFQKNGLYDVEHIDVTCLGVVGLVQCNLTKNREEWVLTVFDLEEKQQRKQQLRTYAYASLCARTHARL